MKRPILMLAGMVFLAGSALAQGYSGMSCDELRYQRNAIFKEAGYCFKTANAIRTFGNAGCRFDDQNDVPLSANARREISAIVAAERRMGCPR